ncbi:MAG: peptidase [Acidimicrobiia bacterium]|nr:peptidase [Acidimicrobiia bacterium]
MTSPRRQPLLDAAAAVGASAVVLRTPESFAWYTGGADSRVDRAAPVGVATMVVTPEGEWVLTSSIEAERFRHEQTPGFRVVAYPWFDSPDAELSQLTVQRPLGSDVPGVGEIDMADAVQRARLVLDADAQQLCRANGALARQAMEEVAAAITPRTTEQEAATLLSAAAGRRGLFSPVVLVAGSRRLPLYRHPLPTGEPLRERAMLVLCAERGGVYANLTHFVHFEPPDASLQQRLDICQTLLAEMQGATRPGRTVGDVVRDVRQWYADAGFPDAWRDHHQGGITGYRSREVVATPDTEVEIAVGQAFAWNPSLPGAKAEETFILTDHGPDVVTGPS